MTDKKILREKNRIIRKKLLETNAVKAISECIVNKIIECDFYVSAKNVMLFYPLKGEVDLISLLKISNKNFYLPRCKEKNIEVCPYFLGDKLNENKYGIKEPVCAPVNPKILDIIFIPALGADLNGNRIGWGKGYYDRFLSDTGITAKKVVVIASALISKEEIKADKFDIKYDILIEG